MPAAVSPTTKLLLRQALALETASVGTGLPFLTSIQTQLVSVLAAGGLQMSSASSAGKAFTFLSSWSTSATAEALDEAFAIWATLDADQITSLLNARLVRVTRARFGCGWPC